MTGYATVQSAVQAMKLGAYDYVTKPFNFEELRLLLERVAAHLKLTSENRLLREQVKSKQGFGGIVGRSPEMEKLYRIIAKAAHSTHPVLILGESGTGKELVARSIHYSGPFRDKPFIPVDCGSLVPTLIESELFGYVRGAFTGAVRSKDGLLAIAEGGTVFLDEIGELPVDLQAKLLRAIQEKEIRPVGGTKRHAHQRAHPGGHQPRPGAGGAAGQLPPRPLLPPERAHPAHSAAARAQAGHSAAGGPLPGAASTRSTGMQRSIGDDALKLMLDYDWPGNVRELENCLERACAPSSGPLIHIADLPTSIQNAQLHSAAGSLPSPSRHRDHRRDGEAGHPGRHRPAARRQAGGRAPAGHRQDHPVPQTEGIRLPGLNWVPLAGFVTGNEANCRPPKLLILQPEILARQLHQKQAHDSADHIFDPCPRVRRRHRAGDQRAHPDLSQAFGWRRALCARRSARLWSSTRT